MEEVKIACLFSNKSTSTFTGQCKTQNVRNKNIKTEIFKITVLEVPVAIQLPKNIFLKIWIDGRSKNYIPFFQKDKINQSEITDKMNNKQTAFVL